MTWKSMQSKVKAVIRFNKREAVRKKIGQYLLLIFLILFVVEEIKEILITRTLTINLSPSLAHASDTARETGDSAMKANESVIEGIKPLSPQLQPEIEEMICKEFKEDCETAIAVARAESSLNPNAIGDKHLSKPSYGLFQISKIYHDYPVETLLNPAENIKIAKKIKDNGGFERWTTYREGTYLKYL